MVWDNVRAERISMSDDDAPRRCSPRRPAEGEKQNAHAPTPRRHSSRPTSFPCVAWAMRSARLPPSDAARCVARGSRCVDEGSEWHVRSARSETRTTMWTRRQTPKKGRRLAGGRGANRETYCAHVRLYWWQTRVAREGEVEDGTGCAELGIWHSGQRKRYRERGRSPRLRSRGTCCLRRW
ncbi:hypothetical protein B0H12DRAFT_517823 [Mycena haematopus]|nr:hypothetical protein B0H12DRAFT_517823 [Mycena haematopus]